MKITDLKIGEFATRNWYNVDNKSLYVKRFSEEKYEYWENGQFSSSAKKDSSIFKRNDFKLCDCNGKLIEKLIYPLFMELIQNGTVVKFDSLNLKKQKMNLIPQFYEKKLLNLNRVTMLLYD